MTYYRGEADPAYREYCAKIVSLQKRFSQEDRERIVREFLSEGLNAKEVSMAQLYSDELLKGKPLEQEQGPSISETMANGSSEDVIRIFNHAVSAIDYQRYPITDEASCRAYMQVLLLGAAMLPQVEVHNALGRSDMEVRVGSRHWVFEFKYSKQNSIASGLLRKAVDQIKSRQYGHFSSDEELIRIALVFSGESKSFIAWEKI